MNSKRNRSGKAPSAPIKFSQHEGDRNPIGITEIRSPERITGRSATTKMFFVLDGSATIFLGKTRNMQLGRRSAFIVPIGTDYRIETTSVFRFISLALHEKCFFDRLHLYFPELPPPRRTTPYPLIMNEKLGLFVENLAVFVGDGICNNSYLQIKVDELFFLLKAYYPPKVLSRFFSPLDSRNASLARIVYENREKAGSLDRLAEMAGLSLSGFSKRFKKVFAAAPYQWIMEKKSGIIYRELIYGEKPIRELARHYGFYSVQHFGYYCKKRFGFPPGRIRKEGEKISD